MVVNNAGYGLFGAVEELTEQALRDQLEANLFGALWVSQAVLPYVGGYHASKWALEGLSESLAQEVSGLGIKVTIVEPGAYATDWGGSSAVRSDPILAYDGVREALGAFMATLDLADPTAAGRALPEVVDSDNPPLRVFFGTQGNEMLPAVYADRLKIWSDWQDVAARAQG